MALAIGICFLAAFCAPFLYRLLPKWTAGLLALVPLAIFAWLTGQAAGVSGGRSLSQIIPWIQSLGLDLAFRLDGLSWFFALLISGIGALVLFYTQGYFSGHPKQGGFLLCIAAFMASMLGVVLADNIILVFVFWELTSFFSYLLIGFSHESGSARQAALQALLVTSLGGLFLLAGLIMLGEIGGSWSISALLEQGGVIRDHTHYLPMLALICVGCFTKSAQVPFHFWLPKAMHAPAPASAYLHSSTMVKAGIYLLARLHPALGGTTEWGVILTAAGVATFLTGAIMALGQHTLKSLLACTTISALGAMTMLLGIGSPSAIQAMIAFVLAHAFYKATLFMVAGSIEHETSGETSIDRLGGLRKAMPFTFAGALLAGLSMGGFPPFFGFVAKESWLHALDGAPWLMATTALGGAAYMLVGLSVGWKPFTGGIPTGLHACEAPWSMRIGPLILGGSGLVLAGFCGPVGHAVVEPATAAIGQPLHAHLRLWSGWNMPLLISLAALVMGGVLFSMHGRLRSKARALIGLARFGPAAACSTVFKGVLGFAAWQTSHLQTGLLRGYIRLIMLTAIVLAGAALIRSGMLEPFEGLAPVSPQLAIVAVLIAVACFATVHSGSRLRSILAMGFVGFGMALLFAFFGAPDLAMTQMVVEALTVLLMALAFHHLPVFRHRSSQRTRNADLVIALGSGLTITLMMLAALAVQPATPVSDYYVENSWKAAHGRNIVNVILVDFRALDTLGEITVLAIAALGASALLKRCAGKGVP